MLEYLLNVFLPGVLFTPQYFTALNSKYDVINDFTWDSLVETARLLVGSNDTHLIVQPPVLTALCFTFYNNDQWILTEGIVAPLVNGKIRIYHTCGSTFRGHLPIDQAYYVLAWLLDLSKCECSNERRYVANINSGTNMSCIVAIVLIVMVVKSGLILAKMTFRPCNKNLTS